MLPQGHLPPNICHKSDCGFTAHAPRVKDISTNAASKASMGAPLGLAICAFNLWGL